MQNPYYSQSSAGSPPVGGGIGQRTADLMARTKGWVRFISVMFFLLSGFMVLASLLVFATGQPEAMIVGVFYVAAAVLLFIIPGVKLTSYANRIGDVLRTGLASELERALNEHRGFWKYIGILQIIGLIFMLIGIVGAFAA